MPSNGKVLYIGISTATMDRDNYCREDVAVIYQAYYLFLLFTTLENVMHPLELKGVQTKEAREKAADIIKRVGLSEEYYDAQWWRAATGGNSPALAAQPKIILADEPTGNIDTENGDMITAILRALVHDSNCCVFIVPHDLAIAQQVDVVLRMEDGRLITS